MEWLTGCRDRMAQGCWHGMEVVAMAWLMLSPCVAKRLLASHGSEVVAMAQRLSALHGMEVVAIAQRLSASHGMEVVAMAWLMLLPWRG
jgi:hypothetical protein